MIYIKMLFDKAIERWVLFVESIKGLKVYRHKDNIIIQYSSLKTREKMKQFGEMLLDPSFTKTIPDIVTMSWPYRNLSNSIPTYVDGPLNSRVVKSFHVYKNDFPKSTPKQEEAVGIELDKFSSQLSEGLFFTIPDSEVETFKKRIKEDPYYRKPAILPLEEKFESSTLDDAYFDRNQAVQLLAKFAELLGYKVGVKGEDSEWPIIYIQLELGQVSWHIPANEYIRGRFEEWSDEWDQHTLEVKRERILYELLSPVEGENESKGT